MGNSFGCRLDRTIADITPNELYAGVKKHPNGFVVPGTLQQWHDNQERLRVEVERGVVFIHNDVLAENKLGKLQILTEVISKDEDECILFMRDNKWKLGFASNLNNAKLYAERVMEQYKAKKTDSHLHLLQPAFEHILGRIQ